MILIEDGSSEIVMLVIRYVEGICADKRLEFEIIFV